jgi:ribose transport system ATP-binding protein
MAELMVGRKLDALYPHKRAAPDATPLLSVSGLKVEGFPEKVSFDLHPGEVLGIGGMIGAGRTELMEALVGLRPSTADRVVIKGTEIPHRTVRSMMEAGLVYLTEDRKGKGLLLEEKLGPNLTLQALDAVNPGAVLDRRRELSELQRAISDFDIRVRSLRLEAGKLSGGNQQKLLLAKVMLAGPSVIIIDEPTRGIDIGNKSQIYEFIDAFVRAGGACIVISSEMQELVGLSDRVLVMRGGMIVAEFRDSQINEENIVYAATTGGSVDIGEDGHDNSSNHVSTS